MKSKVVEAHVPKSNTLSNPTRPVTPIAQLPSISCLSQAVHRHPPRHRHSQASPHSSAAPLSLQHFTADACPLCALCARPNLRSEPPAYSPMAQNSAMNKTKPGLPPEFFTHTFRRFRHTKRAWNLRCRFLTADDGMERPPEALGARWVFLALASLAIVKLHLGKQDARQWNSRHSKVPEKST